MGYKFDYITLSDANGVNIINIYKKVKKLNSKIKLGYFICRFLLTIKMINFLDEFETYIRENIINYMLTF